ncbi:putative enzyme [Bradyrhizobium sp. ORS 375]|uniref:SAM-dependent methyltransferase n=1 Tax=Bradyrhizobium sp. (strain ORS 375) TaxID=566679 RepID=UPI0002409082|nr:cyclopropane-fatty-acyl-phospholipid synthase family protein [Bradyrhizobium sp. ORS 375]CCD91565.1 putative enzyme [Bradyrhizobium sp. ORS 375]
MSLVRHLLERLEDRFGNDLPPVRLVFPDGSFFSSTHPNVTITFHSAVALKALVVGDFSRAADCYVAGDIEVDGPIENVVRAGIALAERLGRFSPIVGAARLPALTRLLRKRSRARSNVHHHYDVGNDFYRLWLDPLMIYSCAYFRTGHEDIALAQEQKLEHICRKLLLRPGDRLLDLGCGWGGLARWAATRHGAQVVGVTLSGQQYAAASDAVTSAGLSDRIDIQLKHYEDLNDIGSFDRIVSVGMYEHVGLAHLPAYFRTVARVLRPGGVFLNHGIVSTDPAGRSRGPPGGEFIDRHVFPGGAVPHLSRVLVELSASGLEFADAEDLRPHYALTLQHWSRRLEQHLAEAYATTRPEIVRTWRVFLAGMACAFDRGWLSIAQVQAFKPSTDGSVQRPWTRGYQYVRPPPAVGAPFSSPLEAVGGDLASTVSRPLSASERS